MYLQHIHTYVRIQSPPYVCIVCCILYMPSHSALLYMDVKNYVRMYVPRTVSAEFYFFFFCSFLEVVLLK